VEEKSTSHKKNPHPHLQKGKAANEAALHDVARRRRAACGLGAARRARRWPARWRRAGSCFRRRIAGPADSKHLAGARAAPSGHPATPRCAGAAGGAAHAAAALHRDANQTNITLLLQIVTSGGPAYFYSAENATLGVSWLLPPAFNLTQAAAYPPATVKKGVVFCSHAHAQKRASDARALASATLQPPAQRHAQPAVQPPELLSVHIPHTQNPFTPGTVVDFYWPGPDLHNLWLLERGACPPRPWVAGQSGVLRQLARACESCAGEKNESGGGAEGR
jgi:hypothetical protein